MKKVGFSLKKLGAIFLGLVLLFLLFSMFSGSKEGFYYGCQVGASCTRVEDTCEVTDRDGNVKTNRCVKEGKKLIWQPPA
jgi:hypothetical protein